MTDDPMMEFSVRDHSEQGPGMGLIELRVAGVSTSG